MKNILGLDIGGANLKMAHTDGTARTVPFELWKHPERLPAALRALVTTAPAFDEVAVTDRVMDAIQGTGYGNDPRAAKPDRDFAENGDQDESDGHHRRVNRTEEN